MKISDTVRTDRAAPEVFRFLCEFWRTPEWDPGVLAALALDPGPPHLGQRIRLLIGLGPVALPMVYRVTAFEPERSITLLGESSLFVAEDRIRVTPSIDGCEVEWSADLSLRGPLALTEALWRPGFRATASAAMDGLRARLADRRPLSEPALDQAA